jgi:hypothetical protein
MSDIYQEAYDKITPNINRNLKQFLIALGNNSIKMGCTQWSY